MVGEFAGYRYAHYACGHRVFNYSPGWLNIDSFDPAAFPPGFVCSAADVYRMDVCREHPFPDACFEAGYCEDFIEHLTQEQLIRFLSEVSRTFCKDGILRLSYPSYSWFLSELGLSFAASMRYTLYEKYGHKNYWCFEALSTIAGRLGFSAKVSSFGKSQVEHLSNLDSRGKLANGTIVNDFVELTKQ